MTPVAARGSQTAGGRWTRPTEKKAGADVDQRHSTTTYTSPAFPLEDAIQIDALLTVSAVAGAGTIALKLQGSQDGTTWFDCPPGAAPTLSAAGSVAFSWGAIGNQGRWVATITGTSVDWNLDTQATLR